MAADPEGQQRLAEADRRRQAKRDAGAASAPAEEAAPAAARRRVADIPVPDVDMDDSDLAAGVAAAVAQIPAAGAEAALQPPAQQRMEVDEGSARQLSSVERLIAEISVALASLGTFRLPVDVAELFSPGRLAAEAKTFGLTPGGAYDLRTGWDLSDKQQQKKCWMELEEQDPEFILGSPKCDAFTALGNLNPDNEKYRETLAEGLEHLRFVMSVYEWQHKRGKKFLHEHPWGAWSWMLNFVRWVAELAGVEVRRGDQCVFGQSIHDKISDLLSLLLRRILLHLNSC